MTTNFVTVTGTFAGATGTVTFTPSTIVTDLTGEIPVLGPAQFSYKLSGGSFTTAPLPATDNAGLLPAGWHWIVTVALTGATAYSYPVLLPHSPSTVNLTALPVSASAAVGGSTLVTSVTAGDSSIVVGGTAAAPTLETGTLDVTAADHPPAAAVAMNGQKITGLANGTASSDGAAFGQIPLPSAAQMGLVAWNYPSIIASGTANAVTAGAVLVLRIPLTGASITVTNMLIGVFTVSASLTASENFIGLYDNTGAQIGTSADQSSAWGGTVGVKTAALVGGPFTGTWPFVYAALVSNFSATGPSFARAAGGTVGTTLITLSATAANLPFAANGTGATVLPPTLTYASNVGTNSQSIWVGLS